MGIRHIAALSLVGWYLMVPPASAPIGTPGARLMTNAPISRWFSHGSFDSAKECEDAQRSLMLKILKDITDFATRENCPDKMPLGRCPGTGLLFDTYSAAYNGQCVATDDPRLKPVDK